MSDIRTTKPLPSVNTIINSIMKYFNISRDELLYSKKGVKHIPKMISIYLLSHLGQIKHKQIAEIFSSLKEQSVTTQILRLKKIIEHDDRIKKMVARITKMIKCEGGR